VIIVRASCFGIFVKGGGGKREVLIRTRVVNSIGFLFSQIFGKSWEEDQR